LPGDRLDTLVLDANGFSWKEHASDTVLLGLLGLKSYEAVPRRLRRLPVLRGLKARYEALSYVNDWRDALCRASALDVTMCNITNLVDYARRLRRIERYDLVVVLHSAAGDSMNLLLRTTRWFRKRRGKLVVFVGNEYDLMAEKLAFLRTARADYVCSQLPIESARWLYQRVAGCEVLAMPHALNPAVYRPSARAPRRDVGFIGASYPLFIGDVERETLFREVVSRAPAHGLVCELRSGNVPRARWAAFLADSRGTIGAESGSYFLDRNGEIVASAKAYVRQHPAASFEELRAACFSNLDVPYVSGKAISSRHFEAVGTRTCQILLEGDYNGILRGGEHYIGVRKDCSNLDDALERFQDEQYRQELVARAHEYVLAEHTYDRRIDALLRSVT
jgi:Glycosyl transferases group 1